MKRLIGLFLVIAILSGIAKSTNPDMSDFTKAISDNIHESTIKGLVSYKPDSKTLAVDAEGIADRVTDAVNNILNTKVQIKDYKLFSVASVKSAKEAKTVAIGLMGKIYVLGDNLAAQAKPALEPIFDDIFSANTEWQPLFESLFN